jgi:hypothetical protein
MIFPNIARRTTGMKRKPKLSTLLYRCWRMRLKNSLELRGNISSNGSFLNRYAEGFPAIPKYSCLMTAMARVDLKCLC